MTARILPREQTGHRKAELTPKTLEALRELDGCSSMAAFELLEGRQPAKARLLYLAGLGQPRAVIAGPRRRS